MTDKFLSTPSARRATSGTVTASSGSTFLSTPSARRATDVRAAHDGRRNDFYPRPPRGGRHLVVCH